MPSRQPKPIIHGRDHAPGGADPIPGIIAGSGGGNTYPDMVLANPYVWAYWPLDDTSGPPHDEIAGRDLTTHGSITYGAAGPFPEQPELTAVTLDGATGWMSYILETVEQADFYTGTVSLPWTWVGWFRWTGTPAPSEALFVFHDMAGGGSVFQSVLGSTSNHLVMGRAATSIDSGDVMPTSDWTMVAATYAGSPTGTMNLYLDGALIGTLIDTTPAAILRVMIGATGNVGVEANFWEGRVAQVAVFTAELTADELADLAGLETASPTAGDGSVLTADGAGGTTWSAPTIEVDTPGGRFNKLVLGTNLTGTDNADGSVTIDATGGGGGATPADTTAWMPLTTSTGGVPELVWDAANTLIPTFTPI